MIYDSIAPFSSSDCGSSHFYSGQRKCWKNHTIHRNQQSKKANENSPRSNGLRLPQLSSWALFPHWGCINIGCGQKANHDTWAFRAAGLKFILQYVVWRRGGQSLHHSCIVLAIKQHLFVGGGLCYWTRCGSASLAMALLQPCRYDKCAHHRPPQMFGLLICISFN